MKCSWNHIDLGWRCGSISSQCKEAIEVAMLLDTKVSFLFNKIRVNVSPKSDWKVVAQQTLSAVECGDVSVYGEGY